MTFEETIEKALKDWSEDPDMEERFLDVDYSVYYIQRKLKLTATIEHKVTGDSVVMSCVWREGADLCDVEFDKPCGWAKDLEHGIEDYLSRKSFEHTLELRDKERHI